MTTIFTQRAQKRLHESAEASNARRDASPLGERWSDDEQTRKYSRVSGARRDNDDNDDDDDDVDAPFGGF